MECSANPGDEKDTLTTLPSLDSDACRPGSRGWRSYVWPREHTRRHAIAFTICLAVSCVAILLGMQLRGWVWRATLPGRFQGDIRNGFNWGLEVNRLGKEVYKGDETTISPTLLQWFAGMRAVYPRVIGGEIQGKKTGLDYTPLRLAIMSLWVNHQLAAEPKLTEWRDELSDFPLTINTIAEVATAAGAFVLVRLILTRSVRARLERLNTRALTRGELLVVDANAPPIDGATVQALIAALLVWFNPAVVIEGHGWPQWDIWCMPFFVWAAVACVTNAWLIGGMLLATGAMFKGQLLLTAPIFLLWPVVQFRFYIAWRLVVGFALATAVITLPWLINNAAAGCWIAGTLLAVQLERLSRLKLKHNTAPLTTDSSRRIAIFRYALIALAVALLVWPFGRGGRSASIFWTCFVVAISFPVLAIQPRSARPGPTLRFATAFSLAIFTGSVLFHGDYSWAKIGFFRPTDHYHSMTIGSLNLPSIMASHFGWKLDDALFASVASQGWPEWLRTMSVQWGMRAFYGVTLVCCSIAAAIHDKRRDARFLVAIAAPWVLFFTLLPQMHQRYLLWGAVATACTATLSLDLLGLHLIVTTLAFGQVFYSILSIGGDKFLPKWRHFFGSFYPDWGWIAIITAAAYLAISLNFYRRESAELVRVAARDASEPDILLSPATSSMS